MRRVGMLGGMSWESTALYYRLANEAVRERLGGLHSASLIIDSVDFADIAALQRDGDWEEAGRVLAGRARSLEAGGAEAILLCTNTMHLVAPAIEAAISVPLLHIADVAAAAALDAGARTVGLLGTGFTMEQSFYRDRLADAGVATIVPGDDDRAEVHRVIFDELVVGVVCEESRRRYREVITHLVDAGAEAIILGCTEIELLVDAGDSAVPVLPTTRLHVDAAVEYMLG